MLGFTDHPLSCFAFYLRRGVLVVNHGCRLGARDTDEAEARHGL